MIAANREKKSMDIALEDIQTMFTNEMVRRIRILIIVRKYAIKWIEVHFYYFEGRIMDSISIKNRRQAKFLWRWNHCRFLKISTPINKRNKPKDISFLFFMMQVYEKIILYRNNWSENKPQTSLHLLLFSSTYSIVIWW